MVSPPLSAGAADSGATTWSRYPRSPRLPSSITAGRLRHCRRRSTDEQRRCALPVRRPICCGHCPPSLRDRTCRDTAATTHHFRRLSGVRSQPPTSSRSQAAKIPSRKPGQRHLSAITDRVVANPATRRPADRAVSSPTTGPARRTKATVRQPSEQAIDAASDSPPGSQGCCDCASATPRSPTAQDENSRPSRAARPGSERPTTGT